ncbi:developmentally regulated phosphoprotein [Trypanosoma rangeli SC58]|uniref:Protein-serine/threonine kinase n=1 Tax=Trypanosoma rangeli SC58 TaxID=429131 RepID=A0A061J6H5_TRYRA|nr:developmentally regulated phosphoprotein [Trypanosoma rangeli SC58]
MRRFAGCLRVCAPYFRHSTSELSNLQRELTEVKKRVSAIEETQTLQALVAFYASRPLQKLDNFDEVLRNCLQAGYNTDVFCHMELPVLLSRLVTAIDTLPCGLNAMPSVLLVRNTYLDSFRKLIKCDFPDTEANIKHFRRVVTEIEDAHLRRDVLITMARGLLELKELLSRHKQYILRKKKGGLDACFDFTLDEALIVLTKPMDNFSLCMVYYNFLSRMLLALEANDDTMVGMVDLKIDLERVVHNAVDDAKQVCTEHYGDCPEVKFIISKEENMMEFPHMSATISYVVFELMKNAFRATVEAHMERNPSGIVDCSNMPPVEVLVNMKKNSKHACICVSDEGLGMSPSRCEVAMTYAYTSVRRPILQLRHDESFDHRDTFTPLAGYGFGLPMSRVYARAFGGDLVMSSMEGYGTRVYYYIKL